MTILGSLLVASFLIQPNPQDVILQDKALIETYEDTIIHNQNLEYQSSLIAQEIPAIREEGFVFQFLGCETAPLSDVPLTCEFLIENSQEEEKIFGLYSDYSSNPTRVIDSSGNEIVATSVQVGSSDPGSSIPFPSGVPIKATVTFGEAPDGIIKLLDIGCFIYQYGGFDVEFRF